jgi:hypothetical protein
MLESELQLLQDSPLNALYDFEIYNRQLIARNNLTTIYITIKESIQVNDTPVYEIYSLIHNNGNITVYSDLVDAVRLFHL